ncbi:efflux RND transporter permease subunit [Aestuariicella hydrocarbonica]|uniref:Efflux pump membrane transporter n=1 Tax=Pseudomaricurvus hydrocarbonicus TaxID=1470433 RepID=A0A9E5JVY7_9GAMM|nr:efflux RND transporter permease subunit [Aestuariicella hydrocarbonica]
MSSFFIDRPIFAWVLAIVTMLAGALALKNLPVSHYPNIAPPAISISVTYPGASAETVQDTVVQVIEQQLNGLDGLRFMSSTSQADGSMQILVTFEQGTDPDIAQVHIQNKLQLANPLLPEEVQRQGIRVAKYQRNFMMVIALIDESGKLTNFDLGNYIASNLKDPISRVTGVGDFTLFGSQYAMRIWLDPGKLLSYQLTPSDVAAAIRAQNVQISVGQIGGLPARKGVQLNATVIGKTRFETPEQFRNILLKANADGSQVKLEDVANVELGSENFSITSKYNGKPAAALALRLATGGNVLETVDRVKSMVDELSPFFPEGVRAVYPYETAPVVAASIESVIHTLIEAFILVFLVMYLFLQNFRATLIPTLAVPVVLLGTLGILYALGFNINVLTMYAMVLAIGLLVDDAIVVVENVERVMEEEGLSAIEATRKSMGQIQGALIGIGLVLSAVFVPMAFFGGSAGVVYRQFSVTIVAAMALSVLVALIFTPALCAMLLKPGATNHEPKGGFFGWFNRTFERNTGRYERGVAGILKRPRRNLLVFAILVAGLGYLFSTLPSAYIAEEDQGIMFLMVQMPANSSSEATEEVLTQVREIMLKEESGIVNSLFTVNGFNFFGRGQSQGMGFAQLKPWEEREGEHTDIFSLQKRLMAAFSAIKSAQVIAVVPPAIMEMGNSSGVNVFLQDRAALGHDALTESKNLFIKTVMQDPRVSWASHKGMADSPQYQIVIDDEKASAYQVRLADINDTMSAAWASQYVNDFIDQGRVKRVYIQGNDNSRLAPEDLTKWFVRNKNGEMVPFSSFSHGRWTYGPSMLVRYNGVPALELQGNPAPGYTSSDVMAAFEEAAQTLPQGIGMEYTGLSYEERMTGDMTTLLYALSLLVVFLCLAALYESWSIPFAVMLVVPLGVLGAVAATLARGLSNDIFFQVGLLTTVGLAAKNAILIVEFARALYEEQGRSLTEAAIEAARLRLRPIVMTSLAFTFGVLPMALATGAGQGSQHAIGTGVVGGMLSATFLAIFFIPLFYVVVVALSEKITKPRELPEPHTEGTSA